MRMKAILILLSTFVLASLVQAAGSIDIYPEGATINATKLAQVRKENLQVEARGPAHSLHLRYRDVWRGKKRTFVWSTQSYTNPDGAVSYAVVLKQVEPVRLDLLYAGCSSLDLKNFGEEDSDDRYRVVYNALDAYLRSHKSIEQLKP